MRHPHGLAAEAQREEDREVAALFPRDGVAQAARGRAAVYVPGAVARWSAGGPLAGDAQGTAAARLLTSPVSTRYATPRSSSRAPYVEAPSSPSTGGTSACASATTTSARGSAETISTEDAPQLQYLIQGLKREEDMRRFRAAPPLLDRPARQRVGSVPPPDGYSHNFAVPNLEQRWSPSFGGRR